MKTKMTLMTIAFAMTVFLAGCGNSTTVTENLNETETVSLEAVNTASPEGNVGTVEPVMEEATGGTESNESAPVEEAMETEPTYTEGIDLVFIDNVDHSRADENDRIDVNAMSLLQTYTHVEITKELDIYFDDGMLAGYAKAGTKPVWNSEDDTWCCLVFEDGTYFAKQEELAEAMQPVTESEESSASDSTSALEETKYTVNDMEKTMFVKQSVNVRSGPGTGYDKVGSLNVNEEIAVTGQADNGWYRFSYNGSDAFISDKYLSGSRVEETKNSASESESNPVAGSSEVTQPEVEVPQTAPEPEPTVTTYTEEEVIAIIRNELEAARTANLIPVLLQ